MEHCQVLLSQPPRRETMRLIRHCFGFFLAFLLLMIAIQPADAASSAAIRAFDDVNSVTQDYSGQDLSRAEFGDVRLINANFSGANMTGAVFNGAVLKNANLHGVNFTDGIAYLSNLSGADLSDAILTSAMMLKSIFRDANVTGADFSDALIDRDQVTLLCQSASGVNPVTGVATRESLGCR